MDEGLLLKSSCREGHHANEGVGMGTRQESLEYSTHKVLVHFAMIFSNLLFMCMHMHVLVHIHKRVENRDACVEVRGLQVLVLRCLPLFV